MSIEPARREALNKAIEAIGTGTVSANEIAKKTAVSGPTVITALKKSGFEQVKRGAWRKPVNPVGWEIPPAPAPETPKEYAEIERASEREARIKAAAEAAPVDIPPVKVEVPAPVPVKAEAPAPVVPERSFLDDVDSWTIPVPKKLQAMAEFMGLNIEVRVWKKPQ